MDRHNTLYYFKALFFNELMRKGINTSKYAIAGGAVRCSLLGLPYKDIDVFVEDKEAEDILITFFKMEDTKVINENDFLLNVVYKGKWFQVIKGKYFDMSTTELVDSFDFTVCCAMVTHSDLKVGANFFEDLATKSLRINRITFPTASFARMQKYIQYGYTACNRTLLKMIQVLQDIDLNNKELNSLEFYPDGTDRFMGIE